MRIPTMRMSDPVKTQATRIRVELPDAVKKRGPRNGPPRHRIERTTRFVRTEPVEEDLEVPEVFVRIVQNWYLEVRDREQD